MKRRVLGSLIAAAGLSAVLMATASGAGAVSAHAAATKKIVVGVSLAGYSTGFWAAYVQYEKGFAKSDGLTLSGPISADGSAATQAENIQTLINEKVNVLLVNPVDSSAIATSDQLAAKAHIPVVMMDVGPTSGHIYAVVRANNLTIGADAAKYICNSAGGAKATGTAAVLQGDLASLNGLDRSNGFIDEMGKVCPEVHVVTYPTLWDSATAVSDATEALNTYSDLKGIYSSFSGPDDGIINAIKAAGKSATVPLVETDGVPAEMALIRQGSLAAAVSQPVNLYAEEGLAYAKLAAQGKPKPKLGSKGLGGGQIVNLNGSPEDALPSIFVTKSNVNAKALWGNTYTGP